MSFDEYEEELVEFPTPERRAHWTDLLPLSLGLACSLTTTLGEWLEACTQVAAGHANYSASRRNFASQVRLELESLPGTGEE